VAAVFGVIQGKLFSRRNATLNANNAYRPSAAGVHCTPHNARYLRRGSLALAHVVNLCRRGRMFYAPLINWFRSTFSQLKGKKVKGITLT